MRRTTRLNKNGVIRWIVGILLLIFIVSATMEFPDEIEIQDSSDVVELIESGVIDELTADELISLLANPIDLNSASWREISALPGISTSDARAIVSLRAELGGEIGSLSDLLRIDGFTDAKVQVISPFCRIRGKRLDYDIFVRKNHLGYELRTQVEHAGMGLAVRLGSGCDTVWSCAIKRRATRLIVGSYRIRFGLGTANYSGVAHPKSPLIGDLIGVHRKIGIGISTEFRGINLSFFDDSSSDLSRFGGLISIVPRQSVSIALLADPGGLMECYLEVGENRVARVDLARSNGGFGLKAQFKSSLRGSQTGLNIWHYSTDFANSIEKISSPEDGVSAFLSGSGGLFGIGCRYGLRSSLSREPADMLVRVRSNGYLSLTWRRLISGGVSAYRYLRGVPDPEYASLSRSAWLTLRPAGALRLEIRFKELDRNNAKPDRSIRVRIAAKIGRAPVDISCEYGGFRGWYWRFTVSDAAVNSRYLRIAGRNPSYYSLETRISGDF